MNLYFLKTRTLRLLVRGLQLNSTRLRGSGEDIVRYPVHGPLLCFALMNHQAPELLPFGRRSRARNTLFVVTVISATKYSGYIVDVSAIVKRAVVIIVRGLDSAVLARAGGEIALRSTKPPTMCEPVISPLDGRQPLQHPLARTQGGTEFTQFTNEQLERGFACKNTLSPGPLRQHNTANYTVKYRHDGNGPPAQCVLSERLTWRPCGSHLNRTLSDIISVAWWFHARKHPRAVVF
ncbi:hypothetical protein CBL_07456 [Carabus blaptoides fortunei]